MKVTRVGRILDTHCINLSFISLYSTLSSLYFVGPTGGGITIFYRVDTRESDTEVLINFTGKLICNLREAVKARSKLTHPAGMLKLVVAGSDKTEIDLEELRKSWTQQGISFSFAKLISEYDINKDNPILVKTPGQ